MADYSALKSKQSGWCYSRAGTPCAYIMDIDEPTGVMMIPLETWWEALRFALSFAETNDCEFIGGLSQ